MKRTILSAALTLSLISTLAIAQPMHSPAEGTQHRQMGHDMMMGQGNGMMGGSGQGNSMMGMHGKKMGMMGMGMGMHGKGMGMMGQSGNCAMGQGMHRTGMMHSGAVAQNDAFLNSTKELRKSIHDKQFEYMEASRNSEETVGSLRKKAEELSALRQDLMEKRQKAFNKE